MLETNDMDFENRIVSPEVISSDSDIDFPSDLKP